MSFKLYSSLRRHAWFIDPTYADSQLPLLTALLSGENVSLNDKPVDLTKVSIATYNPQAGLIKARTYGSYDEAPQGSTAHIKVNGPIMKEDNCGTAGSMSLARMVLQAADHQNISSIIIDADSPGGMVDGTQTFVDAILEAKKKKPVIGWVNDGMAASAMYWPLSACTEVIASRKTDNIGSIGVYISLADYGPALEAKGIKLYSVYADQSTEKNLPVRKLFDEGDETLIKEQMLNPYAEAFISGVKANRGDKLKYTEENDPFKGALFMADEALAIGLIDSIGNFQYAIERAYQLSAGNQTATTQANSISQNNMLKKKFSALSALAGKQAADITAADITAVNDQLKSYGIVGAEISLHGTAAKAAELEKTNATQATSITDLIKERDTYKAEAEKLGAQDGGVRKEAPANPGEKNPGANADATEEYNSKSFSWNQRAANL